jgi:hypothetical protein
MAVLTPNDPASTADDEPVPRRRRCAAGPAAHDRAPRDRRQPGRSVHRPRLAIFAFFALLLAMANMLVTAAKLDGGTTATRPAPAAPAVAARPAPAPVKNVAVSLKEYSVGISSAVPPRAS